MGGDAFDENDNTIEEYDDFESGGSTEVIAFGSRYGPSNITISKKDKEVVFESRRRWLAHFAVLRLAGPGAPVIPKIYRT